jgi:hypothetical protein
MYERFVKGTDTTEIYEQFIEACNELPNSYIATKPETF